MQERESFITNPNVHIIDRAFYMPQLDRYRRIWIYLPPGYRESSKEYAVMYMHDGQNLFEDATAFGEEWKVDETMDSMRNKCIVVGIDNGGVRRGNEFTLNDTKEFGKAEGRQYLEFIVHTLKPYIDRSFYTQPDRDHTILAGSSLGGLISFYGALVFPEIFGTIGVFSPSFWIDQQIMEELQKPDVGKQLPQKLYFLAGGQEGPGVIDNMQAVIEQLQSHRSFTLQIVIDEEGDHSERTWGRNFRAFYKWVRKTL